MRCLWIAASLLLVATSFSVSGAANEPQDLPRWRVLIHPDVSTNQVRALGRVVEDRGSELIVEAPLEAAPDLARLAIDLARIPGRPARPPLPMRADLTLSDSELVAEIAAAVSGDEVTANVEGLSAFPSRRADMAHGDEAADFLLERFQSFAIKDAGFHDHGYQAYSPNVLATLKGVKHDAGMIIVGAHYDSLSLEWGNAPGADDNASGTSAVLEMARVMSGYEFEAAIVFALFSAEELGLLGSAEYAADLASDGANVLAMINLDMIGYLDPADTLDMDLLTNPDSTGLYDAVVAAAAEYTPDLDVVQGWGWEASSDHASFWHEGFPAVTAYEDSDLFSPYIHTADDTVGLSYNHPDLARDITRAVAATVAGLAIPVGPRTEKKPPADGCTCSLEPVRPRQPPGLALALLVGALLAGKRHGNREELAGKC